MGTPNDSASHGIDLVLRDVCRYLAVNDLLKIRLTNKSWNSTIMTFLYQQNKLEYRVGDSLLSVDAFRGLLCKPEYFLFKHIRFDGLDLESKFFSDPETFRHFTMNHCLNITSLSLYNCNIPTGRFLELLAFCKNLNSLLLRRVPSIYQIDSGMGIIHWGFTFKYVRENLAKVEYLTLSECKLRNNDLWGLANEMKNLKRLHIGLDDTKSLLPICGVNQVLRACCNSLTTLILRGSIIPPGLQIDDGMEMACLEKLVLLRSGVDSQFVEQLENFLKVCPKLESLKLHKGTLKKSTLAGVLNNLRFLDMSCCKLEHDAFEDAHCEKLEMLKIQPDLESNGLPSRNGFRPLLQCKKPKLTTLELNMLTEGAAHLKFLDPENYPKLATLSLNNCADVAGLGLRKIFKNFSDTLISLHITGCMDLNDENLCCSDTRESLASLKNLKRLDLSGTSVGNITVRDCIIKMKKLEMIRLSKTSVDTKGINAIMNAAKDEVLASLRKLLTNQLDYKEFKQLLHIAPRVEIVCEVVKNGEIVSIGTILGVDQENDKESSQTMSYIS